MAGLITKNNAKGLLQSGVSIGAVSTTLQNGHTLPPLGAGEYTFGTFVSQSNQLEVVRVTARSGNTITHSATVGAYFAGDRFELRPCAELLAALAQEAAAKSVVTLAAGPNDYTGTPAPAIVSYANVAWTFKFPNANTSTTVNINLATLGNVRVKDREGNDPAIGAIKANAFHLGYFDGTNMVLLTLEPNTVVNPPAITVRQAVQCGAVDANGQANWLTAGTGLKVNLTATAAAVALAFAAGFTSYGANDLVTQLTADAADQFGTLPANVTSYLYADYVDPVTKTGGNTLVPPQYGNTFDRARHALLHFDGLAGSTAIIDDLGNSFSPQGGAKLQSNQTFAGFGATALGGGGTNNRLNGTTDYVRCNDIKSLGGKSWFVRCKIYPTAVPSSGASYRICSLVNGANVGMDVGIYGATNKIGIFLSSNGSSPDISNGGQTTTTINVNTAYTVELTYDDTAGKYYVYVNGVKELEIASSARICGGDGLSIGCMGLGVASSFFQGYIDEFEYGQWCEHPNGTTYTPASGPSSVNQAGRLIHWFDIPNMVMREVTAASSVGGTNPTFTTRNRLFVGEADAGGASISSVRSYAYQGKYRSPLVAVPNAGTRTTFLANIGVDPQQIIPKSFLRFAGGWNGYSAGMVVPATTYYLGTNPPALDPNIAEDSCTVAFLNNANGIQLAIQRGSPNSYAALPPGSGTAQLFMTAQRGF